MYSYNIFVMCLFLFQVGSKQQQNTSSSKILKQQNYSSPVAKVYGSAPSKVTSQPPEFQDIWKQLEARIMTLKQSCVSLRKCDPWPAVAPYGSVFNDTVNSLGYILLSGRWFMNMDLIVRHLCRSLPSIFFFSFSSLDIQLFKNFQESFCWLHRRSHSTGTFTCLLHSFTVKALSHKVILSYLSAENYCTFTEKRCVFTEA